MPRPRLKENAGLPNRWRKIKGTYFYQVPPGHEKFWNHRQTFRLGSSMEEAQKKFDEMIMASACLEPGQELLSAEVIADSARPRPEAGVYFLLSGERIVYVGRSNSILSRIATHSQKGVIEFDSFHFVKAEGLEQERLEALYICTFKPIYNTRHVGQEAEI
jgi:hypothetical protein